MEIMANFKLSNNPAEPVTINATPSTGYEFVNWTEDDVELSKNPTFEFVPVKDTTIIGNFQKKSYLVDVQVEGFGIVSGNGSYLFGDEAVLLATPNDHHKFVGWYKNEVLVGNNIEYKFIVTDNTNLIAKFEKIVYNVTLVANPVEGGTVTIL